MNATTGTSKFISFTGKIHLINTDVAMNSAAAELSRVKFLGFDTETKPSFKKGEVYNVALLQLATATDAYLFRLHAITNFELIKSIFENDSVVKVGCAIRDDLKQLQKIFHFTAKNFVELQELAKVKNLKNFGLKGMTEEVLQALLSKGPKLTNWQADTLTEQQMLYAATDAWIGLELYKKLVE